MERFGITIKPTEKEYVYEDGSLRISVLSDKIVRVEKSADCVFTNKPTQTVINRNFAKPQFKVDKTADKIVVKTNFAKFYINKNNLKTEVELDGKLIKPSAFKNLGGTARTLDCNCGIINRVRFGWQTEPFGFANITNGIMSLDGVAVLDDGKSALLNDDGSVEPRKKGVVDKYILAFGNDYLGGLKQFYSLTGFTPKIPKYALGNWWSRYHDYSEKSYLALMDKFEAKEIPLTVATVDMDWHIVKNVPKDASVKSLQGRGWTGYTFEKSLFPDYRRFLQSLKNKGLAITMNLHPRDGVRYFEQQYDEMAKLNGIDPTTKATVEFDLTDKSFLNSYFDVLHHPYENDGVDFWWIDWQQGTKSAIKGIDPLWLLNHYHFLDISRGEKKGLILSRYAGLGSHRYPLGFSGDTVVSWSSLRMQPYFTALAANAGYTWWSHDIGGHMFGSGKPELYLRWLQLGVFSPINRLHSTKAGISKEPWLYGERTEKISNEYLRLRHRMLPYLYTASVLTAEEGTPLVAPLYYYSKNKEAYSGKNRNSYFFGSELFVAPVVKKADKKGFVRQTVWFPEGEWTDIFSGKTFKGGEKHLIFTEQANYPVYIKKGGILPLLQKCDGNSQDYDKLEIRVYLGNNNYTLYDEKGKIDFSLRTDGENAFFEIKPSLDIQTKDIKIVFCDIKGADIFANGKSCGRNKRIDVACKHTKIELKNIVTGGITDNLIKP